MENASNPFFISPSHRKPAKRKSMLSMKESFGRKINKRKQIQRQRQGNSYSDWRLNTEEGEKCFDKAKASYRRRWEKTKKGKAFEIDKRMYSYILRRRKVLCSSISWAVLDLSSWDWKSFPFLTSWTQKHFKEDRSHFQQSYIILEKDKKERHKYLSIKILFS